MYLRALEIQGFKSFPDKTVLRFGEDITAIVGPNGSGKSNISDAIRWVMGEQSSRSLRGAKMEDVIFGGTEKRPAVGFAQVTLVLDNAGGIFPAIDSPEVMVTRRYYRSGESEYYINRQAVRLKDINELFMDTGLGKEGYSLIGQGQIAEILSLRSTDRRGIFEEAAGISRFRHRKEEAERRLEKTEENLVRVNDKIAELELQVEPLRDQAEKAKRFLLLRDELRLLEISVWLEELEAVKAAAMKRKTDHAAAAAARDQAEEALNALYRQGEAYSQQVRQNDMDAEAVREEMRRTEARSSEEDSAMAVLRSDIRHSQETRERLQTELEAQQGQASGLEEKIRGQRDRVAALTADIARLEEETGALLEELRQTAARSGTAQSEAEALRAKEALASAAAAASRERSAALAAAVQELEERRQALERDQAGQESQWADIPPQAGACRRSLEEAEEEAQSAKNVIEGHALRLAGRQRREQEAQERHMSLTMALNDLLAKVRLLSEMEKEHEGYNKAVRLVMQAAERQALRGVHGPVAGLLQTGEPYTVAIETALGARMQNIVVDREEDAKGAIQYLKQRDAGRATFLPLTAIRGEPLRERGVEEEPGYVGIAAALVDYDPAYDQIVQSLLGRTVVVEDLDSGIRMARAHQHRFRVVTLDGQVIERGGSMTGGSASRSAGILSRRGELERLREREAVLQGELSQAAKEREAAGRDLSAARYEMEAAEGQRRAAEDQVLRLQGERGRLESLLEALGQSREALDQEREALDSRLSEARQAIGQEEAASKGHEDEAQALGRQAEERLAGQSGLQSLTDRLNEALSEKRSLAAAAAAERETTLGALADLERLWETMRGDSDSRRRRMEEQDRDRARWEAELDRRTEAAAALRLELEGHRERLRELTEEKLRIEQARTAANRTMQESNSELNRLSGEVSRLEQQLTASELEERQILDRLWERYELSHSAAREQRIELESLPKANRRITELKRSIGALGNVNLGAVEEFERVNGRYTYLTGQRDDVAKAKEELTKVIQGVTAEMTAIFAQQFPLIDAAFQEIFQQLFGGGKATLELEDPADILNCGIEIRVQPPGKALKTITLLSGGEKAFVAIALYFAILKVHPTPFCVMDEIEAALDDANVTRFARYMRTIAGKTQFIVITHRRGTMEEADVLYGVTMQEKGVSKILTIDLNDVAAELHIQ